MKRLLITTGDPDGIGLEVTTKALLKIPRSSTQFVIWRSPHVCQSDLSRLKKLRPLTIESSEDLKNVTLKSGLVEIVSTLPPARWVEDAARLCLQKKANALVTGPLSKSGIRLAGLKEKGHTGILARLAHRKDLFMGFYGSNFSVMLITDHLPLKDVSRALSKQRLKMAFRAAIEFKAKLRSRKPIAWLGLNPHAGEDGLIGSDEKMLKSVFRSFDGPIVPDAAFLKKNWGKYSLFVCPYHDQGLIPFKMIHGFDEGVHLTLGLPFVRTSVDHGTAKDIYGKDMAQAGSMLSAILLALKWTNARGIV